MANGIEINNRSFKSIAAVNMVRLGDGVLMNFPNPTGLTIQEGIEQKEVEGVSETGERVRLYSYPRARKPTAVVSFMHLQPELLALRMGNQLEEASVTASVPIKVWVQKAEYAAKAAGQKGYGVAEDVNLGVAGAPVGSVTRGELSVVLTQAAWANYSSWRTNPLTFAIGANGALRFSDDLVTASDVVSINFPVTETMARISDELAGSFKVDALLVDSTNSVHYLSIFNATIDLANASLDAAADTVELNLFLNTPPGSCRAWNLYSPKTNKGVACAAD